MAAAPSDKDLALLACCRPNGDPLGCRRTRGALGRAAADPALHGAWELQQALDAPLAAGVQTLPLPADFQTTVEDGLRLAAQGEKRSWRATLREPAVWAALFAVTFLAAWGGWAMYERAVGFPGDDKVRQLVNLALKARLGNFEPLDTECGKLGDTLFLRHNLADFEVPEAFAHEAVAGYRMFKKDEEIVTQVQTHDESLVFLVFRADGQGVNIAPDGRWKHMDNEGWIAAVTVQHRVCFVAVSRGSHPEADARLRVAKN